MCDVCVTVVLRTSSGGLDITRYTLVYRLLHDQHQTGMFSTLYSLHNFIYVLYFCTCHKLKTCSWAFAYFYIHWCIHIPMNTGALWACHFQLDAAKCSVRSPCYRSMNRENRSEPVCINWCGRGGGLVPLSTSKYFSSVFHRNSLWSNLILHQTIPFCASIRSP